jgi:hypothetical protein
VSYNRFKLILIGQSKILHGCHPDDFTPHENRNKTISNAVFFAIFIIMEILRDLVLTFFLKIVSFGIPILITDFGAIQLKGLEIGFPVHLSNDTGFATRERVITSRQFYALWIDEAIAGFDPQASFYAHGAIVRIQFGSKNKTELIVLTIQFDDGYTEIGYRNRLNIVSMINEYLVLSILIPIGYLHLFVLVMITSKPIRGDTFQVLMLEKQQMGRSSSQVCILPLKKFIVPQLNQRIPIEGMATEPIIVIQQVRNGFDKIKTTVNHHLNHPFFERRKVHTIKKQSQGIRLA